MLTATEAATPLAPCPLRKQMNSLVLHPSFHFQKQRTSNSSSSSPAPVLGNVGHEFTAHTGPAPPRAIQSHYFISAERGEESEVRSTHTRGPNSNPYSRGPGGSANLYALSHQTNLMPANNAKIYTCLCIPFNYRAQLTSFTTADT